LKKGVAGMNLLLHICCAPCSLSTWKNFQEKGHRLHGYFFNPNIHPYREFRRRKKTLQEWAQQEGRPLTCEEDYLLEDFLRLVVNREKERCRFCYRWRLEKTAAHAREQGFESFSTTLMLSPYQKHDLLQEIGGEVARKYGLRFIYEDLRPLFRESMGLAREKGLYMQGYCGCIYSEKERYS
jgi:predicted adenine nucleotide alpha hydrolase (AANH) superfamily ATPase